VGGKELASHRQGSPAGHCRRLLHGHVIGVPALGRRPRGDAQVRHIPLAAPSPPPALEWRLRKHDLRLVLQVCALHFEPLALVQPLLAVELIFVFGYIALSGRRQVKLRESIPAIVLCAGLGLFLFAASPSEGSAHAPGRLWWPGGLICIAAVTAALVTALGWAAVPAGYPPAGLRHSGQPQANPGVF
jgi:hypothetical protein